MWKSSGIICLLLSIPTALVLPSVPVWAAGKQFTWYLDGAAVEQEIEITNGGAEVLLPPELKPGSLRVKPLGSARLARVELVPVTPGRIEEKEASRLAERREELLDRLKALDVKEEIFKATAKSQGGKAPRRTRTNPEPLAAIRQGTDFAIARLEDVYKARRRVEREIKELEKRQSVLQQQDTVSGKLARIRLDGRKGVVRVSYLLTGKGWQPRYDVRVSGEKAEVTMSAQLPRDGKNAVKVVPARLADPPVASAAVGVGSMPRIAAWKLPVTSEISGVGGIGGVTVKLRNDSGWYFPSGDAAVFIKEEYIGTAVIPGVSSGGVVELTVGDGAGKPDAAVKD
jgi:hypothetical protein